MIPAGTTVLFDAASPQTIRGVLVQKGGALVFVDGAVRTLRADYFHVLGRLQIGTRAQPFAEKATIVLTNPTDLNENIHGTGPMATGTKLLGVTGTGRLELHGVVREPTWTRSLSASWWSR